MARQKPTNEIEWLFNYGIYLPTRTIRLDGVSVAGARRFLDGFHILESLSSEPINIRVNSPGGYVVDGFAIYDAISLSECYVTARVCGEAASMGSVIVQAADSREMTAHSTLMLHNLSAGLHGEYNNLKRTMGALKIDQDRMYKVYADKTGKSVAYFKKRMTTDWYLTPKQALAEGLVDKIVESK